MSCLFSESRTVPFNFNFNCNFDFKNDSLLQIHTYIPTYVYTKKSLNGNFNFIHSSRVQFMLFWFSVVVCASSEFSILKFLSSILHSHWLRICMQYHNHLYASNLKVSDDVELLCNR